MEVCLPLLHRNGNSSIVVCVFISAGTRLPSPFQAINVYSGSGIPAFRRHVTIFTDDPTLSIMSVNILADTGSINNKRDQDTLLIIIMFLEVARKQFRLAHLCYLS
jgi:hypothetical protein